MSNRKKSILWLLVLAGLLVAVFMPRGDGGMTTAAGAAAVDGTLAANGKIAFVKYFSDFSSTIYVMNADGTGQTKLTNDNQSESSPSWSPDGSKIAFERPARGDDSNIYVMNGDGSNLKQLTFIEPGDLSGHQPTWSPDGKKIAFVLTTGPGSGGIIEVMNPDGTGLIRLNANCYYQGKPAWSPDGTRIAIVGRRNEQLKDCVYVMNADGTGMTCIADQAKPADHVAWSPDGSKLLYARVLDPSNPFSSFSNLYLVNSAGGISIQLTSGAHHDYAPVWSPDGNVIAFDTDRNQLSCSTGRCSEIFLMKSDGSNQRSIADQPVVGTVFDWQSLTEKPIGPSLPAALQLSAPVYTVSESAGSVPITVTRLSDLSGEATVEFATTDGTARARSDYTSIFRALRFAPGEGEKVIVIPITNNAFVQGDRTVNITLSNAQGAHFGAPTSAVLTITEDDVSPPTTNPLDSTQFFVSQHYSDFLNRVPDQSGLNFWTKQITSCGTNQQCIEAARINVSAAFFLSIEFQQTGVLVERLYKTAYGDATVTSALGGAHQFAAPIVRFDEFLPDTQEIGQDLIVGQSGWETVLEINKETFLAQFVQRSRFAGAFPNTMTPTQFVDKLNTNAGNVLSPSERAAIIALFGSAADTSNTSARAQALRQVAENQKLSDAEFNRAFVLMEYFGYLRRNPDEGQDKDYTGYDFWLMKLNQFNGNFINAEMVKAFITSAEYRQRFGP